MADRIWEEYENYERILALNGYHIESMNLTKRHSWEVKIKDGPLLILGRADTGERLQRFIDVYPKLIRASRLLTWIYDMTPALL